jgi:hypothetical protein
MPSLPNHGYDSLFDLRVDDTNALDELPGTCVEQQKFGLFTFFDVRRTKVPCCNRLLVDFVKLRKILEETSVIRTSIAFAACPAAIVALSPLDRGIQVCFKMHNGPLTAPVRQFWVVSSVKEVQHDRARTEVKWDGLANFGSRVTIDLKGQPPCLDLSHTDIGVSQILSDTLGIRTDGTYCQYGRKILYMSDVVDLRIDRR